MKKIIAMLLTLVLILSLAACGGTSDSGKAPANDQTPVAGNDAVAEKPFAGETITIVTTGSGPVYATEKYLNEFEEMTGIDVILEQYEFQEAINKIGINAAAGGSDIDVICYRPIQETLTWYNNGYFAPLNDYIAAAGDEYDYEDFSPAAREVTTVDGTIVGIPYLTEGEMLWMNTELFEKYGQKAPTNLDELLACAQAMYDPANNVYGISVRGEGNGAVTQFSGFLYAFGGDFFDENLNATMNTPEALAALEYYAELVKCGPEGSDVATMNNSLDWFLNGITAMRVDAYTHNVSTTDPERSLVYDKLDWAPLPEGAAGCTPYNIVAWAWGISSTSNHKDAAWEYIKWISSKDMDVLSQLEGGSSARVSTWTDERCADYADAGFMEAVATISAVGKPYDRPFCANASEVRALVGKMIDAANSGQRGDELKATVEDLNNQMQAILDTEK